MKKLNYLSSMIQFTVFVVFVFVFGAPVAADTGKHPSISQLSHQIEVLTRQLHGLQSQINGHDTDSHSLSLKK